MQHLLLVMTDGHRAQRLGDALGDALDARVTIAPSLDFARLLHARGGFTALLVDRALRRHPALSHLRAQVEAVDGAPVALVRETPSGRVLISGGPSVLHALLPTEHAHRAAA